MAQQQTSFIFQINEVRQRKSVHDASDANGHWVPPLYHGQTSVAQGQGATGIWWVCNGTQIYEVDESTLPDTMTLYSTFSVFFSYGFGFRILHGDATNPPPGEAWHPLSFEHDDGDGFSSHLTNVMHQPSLRCHREDQAWVRMLLPNTLHGPRVTAAAQGALKGQLPIFLALLALSMPHGNVRALLPRLFQNGQWITHTLAPGSGWSDKRGVVVTVYAVPSWAGGSARHIADLEEGRSGKYYH